MMPGDLVLAQYAVADRLDPSNTCRVLAEAARNVGASTQAAVYMDSGIENMNRHVDELFEGDALRRVLAQIDVSFSNSMIEARVSIHQAQQRRKTFWSQRVATAHHGITAFLRPARPRY